ncbi:hypothetical protein BGZ83_007113 [Gryganskiella cystojenkinii]|nr:hypothetical protein BGZ83_007113 [Gryganskiella cystojenkinii]
MHNLEDMQETTVAIPIGHKLTHALRPRTLDTQNVIGAAIFCTDKTIAVFFKDKNKEIVRLATSQGKSPSNGREVTLLELPFRPPSWENEDNDLSWTILQGRNQFYVVSDFDFELWQLPTAAINRCTLLGVGDTCDGDGEDQYGRYICTHGSYHIWNQDGTESWFGTSNKELSGLENIIAIWKNIPRYTDEFDTYPVTYRKALAEFIVRHINKDPRHILASNNSLGYWIPSPDEFSANAKKDMIAHLIAEFKLPVAEILIDYCLARAHSTDPALLEKLMVSVPHLIPKHPDVALNIARRAAFLPVLNRDQLLQQAVYNGDQWGRGKFWVPAKTKLYEVIDQNPVFHRLNRLALFNGRKTLNLKTPPGLLPMTAETVKKNADIKTNLYMAPFSLVWTTQGNKDGSEQAKKDEILFHGVNAKQLLSTAPVQSSTTAGEGTLVLRMIWHFVFPFDTVHIHTIYSDLKAFDNPAMTALMTYKWSRFARFIWCIRLFFQIAYELLFLGITFFQLYDDQDPGLNLQAGYVAIAILGYMLLHFEFQQMHKDPRSYFSSPYNYVDIASFGIPMVASCFLIANSESVYSLRAFSFSVILIYIHFIFELRMFKNMSKIVTIIVNILLEIPAFFIVLTIFILSFAHAINHLIEVNFRSSDCLSKDNGGISTCQIMRDEFPRSYFQSVSATYFFMTGDYDTVKTSLTVGHWTTVLMMNLVIALMNEVYGRPGITGEQSWLKNRLDLIAGAENLSFFLPYFRDHFDYFPKWVYYTATDKEMEEYRKRYMLDEIKPRFVFRSEKDGEEKMKEVKAVVKEDSERNDDGDGDVEEDDEVQGRICDAGITTVAVTPGQNATNTSQPLSSPETQDLVKALKAELSEIKDQLALQDELWQAERKKQQAERALQDQRHQKLEDMLRQMLLINQRSD